MGKSYCETGIENDEIKWKVHTETHIFELMNIEKAFDFWRKMINNLNP